LVLTLLLHLLQSANRFGHLLQFTVHLTQLLILPVLLTNCFDTLLIESLSLVGEHDVLLSDAFNFLTSCQKFVLLALQLFSAAFSFRRGLLERHLSLALELLHVLSVHLGLLLKLLVLSD
jgi:hypothetical protein